MCLSVMLLDKTKQLRNMPNNKLITGLDPIHHIFLKPISINFLLLLNHIDVTDEIDKLV